MLDLRQAVAGAAAVDVKARPKRLMCQQDEDERAAKEACLADRTSDCFRCVWLRWNNICQSLLSGINGGFHFYTTTGIMSK